MENEASNSGSDAAHRVPQPRPDDLFRLVYDELRSLARRRLSAERRDHTLDATSLVHEAYLKLADQTRAEWQGRTHFFAVAAEAMRRILIDHARGHRAAKRGGGHADAALSDATPAEQTWRVEETSVAEVLEDFEREHPRQATVAKLRFFAGLGVAEIADSLGVSERTVKNDWRFARAWLEARMTEADGMSGTATR